MINQPLKQFNIKPGIEDKALHQSWQAYKQKNREIFKQLKVSDDYLPKFYEIIKWWIDALENKHITESAFTTNILMDQTIRPGTRSIFYGMLGRYCSDNNICEEFVEVAFHELSTKPKIDKVVLDKYEYENNNTENILSASTGITSCGLFIKVPYIPDYHNTEKLLAFYNKIKLSCSHARTTAVIKENPEIKNVHLKYMFENYINYEYDKKQDKLSVTYLGEYVKHLNEWVAETEEIKLNAFIKMAILLERHDNQHSLEILMPNIKNIWPEHKRTIELAESLNNLELLINILKPITCDYDTQLPELL